MNGKQIIMNIFTLVILAHATISVAIKFKLHNMLQSLGHGIKNCQVFCDNSTTACKSHSDTIVPWTRNAASPRVPLFQGIVQQVKSPEGL